jgi:hypothetical protein
MPASTRNKWSNLSKAGRDAFAAARDAAPEERFRGAWWRYATAVELEARVRDQWLELGEPLTTLGASGSVVAHPLVPELRRSAAHAAALSSALGLDPLGAKKIEPGRRGRPPGEDPLDALGAPALRAVR